VNGFLMQSCRSTPSEENNFHLRNVQDFEIHRSNLSPDQTIGQVEVVDF